MVAKSSQTDPKMIPKLFQNDPKLILKWPQIDPKFDPKLIPMIPKWFQNHPKVIPKQSQIDAKMIPKWSQNNCKWSQRDPQAVPKGYSLLLSPPFRYFIFSPAHTLNSFPPTMGLCNLPIEKLPIDQLPIDQFAIDQWPLINWQILRPMEGREGLQRLRRYGGERMKYLRGGWRMRRKDEILFGEESNLKKVKQLSENRPKWV